jgi:hypothetical protein
MSPRRVRGVSQAQRRDPHRGPHGLGCKLAPFKSKPGCILPDNLPLDSRSRSLTVERASLKESAPH